MKWFLGFFTTSDMFSILPALTLRSIRCPDAACDRLHGYELGLHWGEWGIGLGFLFSNDDPAR